MRRMLTETLNSNSQNAMKVYDAVVLIYTRDSAWLVSELRGDECDGVDGGDGGITITAESIGS